MGTIMRNGIEYCGGGSSGSGGHTIENPAGTDMTQRANLQFADAHLTDDSTNDRTAVEVVNEVTAQQWASATADGIYHVDDDTNYVPITGDEIAYDSNTSINEKIDDIVGGDTNVAVKNADNNFTEDQTIDSSSGTTTSPGSSYLTLGNDTPDGTEGNSRGVVRLYGNSTFYTNFRAPNPSANRDIRLPDNSGIVALNNIDNNFSANQTINRAGGTTTTPGSTTIEIGNSTPAGTAGNSYGRVRIYSQSEYYGMVQPTSLTANRTLVMPDKSGTLALTSDVTDVTEELVTTGAGTSINIAFCKCGKIVYVKIGNGAFTAVAGATLFTIPEGFEPYMPIDVVDTYSGKRLQSTERSVYCAAEALSSTVIRGTFCYICK